MRIGVISDTHGLLRAQAVDLLQGVDHILHAGDIGRREIIARLEEIAPTTAIRGNVDTGGWAAIYPEEVVLQLAGRTIRVLHDIAALKGDASASGMDMIVSGHSHRPKIERLGDVLHLNPGSAGPRRFRLPVALATVELTATAIRPRLHEIA